MQVVGFPLEFGTVPIQRSRRHPCSNWLHIYFDQTSTRWGGIKKQIRDAFYVDEYWWKAAVFGRSVDMILRAGRGLQSEGR